VAHRPRADQHASLCGSIRLLVGTPGTLACAMKSECRPGLNGGVVVSHLGSWCRRLRKSDSTKSLRWYRPGCPRCRGRDAREPGRSDARFRVYAYFNPTNPKKFSKANARNWNSEVQAPPNCFTVSGLGCAVLHGSPCAELRPF
jgi:hypothetical protein